MNRGYSDSKPSNTIDVQHTILCALCRMDYHSRRTGHRFRGLASTILHEHDFRHDYIESQLAHQEPDETSASYNHALYLKERRVMMHAWADMLDIMANDEGQVIPLNAFTMKAETAEFSLLRLARD